MNGHEDAAADAAILSRAGGRPIRVQWTREDETGLGSERSAPADHHFGRGRARRPVYPDRRTELWIPKTTRGPAEHSITLAPEAAGLIMCLA